jgi:hypothetical protein
MTPLWEVEKDLQYLHQTSFSVVYLNQLNFPHIYCVEVELNGVLQLTVGNSLKLLMCSTMRPPVAARGWLLPLACDI